MLTVAANFACRKRSRKLVETSADLAKSRQRICTAHKKSILHLLRAVLARGGGEDIHVQTPRSRIVVAGKGVVSPSLTIVKPPDKLLDAVLIWLSTTELTW